LGELKESKLFSTKERAWATHCEQKLSDTDAVFSPDDLSWMPHEGIRILIKSCMRVDPWKRPSVAAIEKTLDQVFKETMKSIHAYEQYELEHGRILQLEKNSKNIHLG